MYLSFFYCEVLFILLSQINEEVAKLLELKAQVAEDGPKKFVLKCPKV